MADNSNFLTLMDLRATLMPDGSPVSSYAELLAKENDILDDIPWTAGNQLTGDIHFKRTALPTAQVRRINQGFDSSKGAKESVTETMCADSLKDDGRYGRARYSPKP